MELKKKKLLIFGDSFCLFREHIDHWPYKLAIDLDLELIGFGLPGASWWYVRKKLLALLAMIDLNHVELVIGCHTEPNRIIGSQETIQHSDHNKHIVKTYLGYLQNIEFNHWCCIQWFKELNEIFVGHKTVHIQNFTNTDSYFGILHGIKARNPTLSEISRVDSHYKDPFDLTHLMYDKDKYNHLSVIQNHQLANFLSKIYRDNQSQWLSRDIQVCFE